MSFLPWGTFKRPCPMPACWASANMQPSQWRAGWERITARFLTHQPLLPLAPACGWAPQALAGCRSPDPACRRHSHPWGARRHPDTLPQAAWASSASQPCFKPALALCSTVHHGATAIPAALVGVLIHNTHLPSVLSTSSSSRLRHTQENPGHPRLRALSQHFLHTEILFLCRRGAHGVVSPCWAG